MRAALSVVSHERGPRSVRVRQELAATMGREPRRAAGGKPVRPAEAGGGTMRNRTLAAGTGRVHMVRARLEGPMRVPRRLPLLRLLLSWLAPPRSAPACPRPARG